MWLREAHVRDNHSSLSVGVEAKHPGRLKEDEAAPVRALGSSQKSRHPKRLVELGQAEAGEGASDRGNYVNRSLRASQESFMEYKKEGVVGWDHGGEVLVALVGRHGAELYSRSPMFW